MPARKTVLLGNSASVAEQAATIKVVDAIVVDALALYAVAVARPQIKFSYSAIERLGWFRRHVVGRLVQSA